jgi:hypothetical protein
MGASMPTGGGGTGGGQAGWEGMKPEGDDVEPQDALMHVASWGVRAASIEARAAGEERSDTGVDHQHSDPGIDPTMQRRGAEA